MRSSLERRSYREVIGTSRDVASAQLSMRPVTMSTMARRLMALRRRAMAVAQSDHQGVRGRSLQSRQRQVSTTLGLTDSTQELVMSHPSVFLSIIAQIALPLVGDLLMGYIIPAITEDVGQPRLAKMDVSLRSSWRNPLKLHVRLAGSPAFLTKEWSPGGWVPKTSFCRAAERVQPKLVCTLASHNQRQLETDTLADVVAPPLQPNALCFVRTRSK